VAVPSSQRISQQPRKRAWCISPPRRRRRGTAGKPRMPPRSAFFAQAQVPGVRTVQTSRLGRCDPNLAAESTPMKHHASVAHPSSPHSPNMQDKSIFLIPSLGVSCASRNQSAATVTTAKKKLGSSPCSPQNVSSPNATFRNRQASAWSSGPMSRKQMWPGTQLRSPEAVERQQLLEELWAETFASSASAASLWEINKARYAPQVQ
jgi:hypothetical protein